MRRVPGQCGQGRALCDRAGTRRADSLEGRHLLGQWGRHGGVPDPPPRHGVRFGDTVDGRRARGDLGPQAGDGNVFGSIEENPLIDLVCDDQQIVVVGQAGNLSKQVPREDRPGGIAWRVDDQGPRGSRDGSFEGVGIGQKAGVLVRFHQDRPPSRATDLFGVGKPMRCGDHYFISRLQSALQDAIQAVLAAAGDDDLVPVCFDVIFGDKLVRDRFPQIVEPGLGGVSGEVICDGLATCLLDGVGRWEVRFARAQIQQIRCWVHIPFRVTDMARLESAPGVVLKVE
ncbi:MAG: hypothetical protein V1800_13225 [Candidatus Latescibacterota bacterium]